MEYNPPRKLTRSTTDRKIAGVCGGLGQYMNTDSTVLRLIFVLACLLGFAGIFAYILAWLIMPEENMLQRQ